MPLTIVMIILFFLTLILVIYLIKKTIYIAHKKHLFDEPGEERKIHQSNIPNLGGIAIFGTLMFTCTFFVPQDSISHINRLFPSALILFSLGLIDDLVGMDPLKKFATQIAAALLVCTLTDYRIEGLYGILGIDQLPPLASILLSTLFLILTINAINLSDGINGLAGSLGLLCAVFFSIVFYQSGSFGFLTLSVALAATMTGFLVFNRSPAQIFMGDTGAIFTGFLLGVFSLHYLHLKSLPYKNVFNHPEFAPAYICAILLVPFFDTIRIFLVRISQGKSPFKADRSHLHHRLVDLNLSHERAVLILLVVTVIAIVFCTLVQPWGMKPALGGLLVYISLLDRVLTFVSRRKWHRLNKRNDNYRNYPAGKIKIFGNKKAVRKEQYDLPRIGG